MDQLAHIIITLYAVISSFRRNYMSHDCASTTASLRVVVGVSFAFEAVDVKGKTLVLPI